jgi:FkbM family methyltransferase
MIPLQALSLLAWISLAPSVSFAQPAVPLAPPGAPASAFPAPDRPVAEIISPIWATEEQRDAVDESGQIVRRLGLKPGMTVADIGAGSGYHTVRLARALGPSGRVIAQDVMPNYLADLQQRVRGEGLGNVTVALGDPHDPRLPAGSVEVALMVHMYHEIEQPFGLLYNLVPALKPNARVAIVDLNRVTWEHGTPKDLLRCELAAAGYEQESLVELAGDIGYLAVFKPPTEASRVRPEAMKPCRMQKP